MQHKRFLGCGANYDLNITTITHCYSWRLGPSDPPGLWALVGWPCTRHTCFLCWAPPPEVGLVSRSHAFSRIRYIVKSSFGAPWELVLEAFWGWRVADQLGLHPSRRSRGLSPLVKLKTLWCSRAREQVGKSLYRCLWKLIQGFRKQTLAVIPGGFDVWISTITLSGTTDFFEREGKKCFPCIRKYGEY